MAFAKKLTREERREMKERAEEWKGFRRDYLFTVQNLADAIECSKRTVLNIESGRDVIRPYPELLRRFRMLKLQTQAEIAELKRRIKVA